MRGMEQDLFPVKLSLFLKPIMEFGIHQLFHTSATEITTAFLPLQTLDLKAIGEMKCFDLLFYYYYICKKDTAEKDSNFHCRL